MKIKRQGPGSGKVDTTLEEMPLLLTQAELADVLGYTRPTIDRMRQAGAPTVRVSRQLLFPRDKLINWLRSGAWEARLTAEQTEETASAD